MRLIFLFLVLFNVFNILSALVCPIYLPRKVRLHSHQSLLKTCEQQCMFQTTSEPLSACLGVYSNYSGEIWMKQLAIISSDEQCATAKECLLDVDPLNSQSFSCCCSTDNCTLTWRSVRRINSTPRSIAIQDQPIVQREDNQHFSWKIFLIVFLFILILLLMIFTLTLWKSLHSEKKNLDQQSFVKPSFSPSIEQLFFSTQPIHTSRNTMIYRTMLNNESTMVLKVYQQIHMPQWNNEVTVLKSIQHESIIKILSDGQYNSHLYLLLPYYENGTLQSYLRTSDRILSVQQCLTYFRSLASAISYLHLGQTNLHRTIVHRDIKSSNILIGKNEFQLCLADFGIALALPSVLTEKDFVQIGTTRYMAPELLQGIIAHTREALCSVDMYALALVFWEIISQCEVYPTTVYRPPYDEYVPYSVDGSLFATQLHDIVVVRQYRPSLHRALKNEDNTRIIQDLCALIEQCWTHDADLRMNAQTLAFKLNQLIC